MSWTGLIDDKNQFCLANDGLPKELGKILPRQQTFCQYALSRTEPLIVENLQKDQRFQNHPFVEDGFIKFLQASQLLRVMAIHWEHYVWVIVKLRSYRKKRIN